MSAAESRGNSSAGRPLSNTISSDRLARPMTGMLVSFMAAGAANPAISYALSNAAPVVAILWGVFVWKEFKGAPKGTNSLLAIMFGLFVVALVLITLSNS